MKHLLQETVEAIGRSGRTIEDVSWVGTLDGKFRSTWDEFADVTYNVTYNDGYGAPEVATDLIVMFNDGNYMSRGEYVGSEWWEWTLAPEPVTGETRRLERVLAVGVGWESVEGVHRRLAEQRAEDGWL